MTRLPAIVRAELESSGVAYEIKKGSRHHKLYVAGRMVSVLPYSSKAGDTRAPQNIRATVRRVLREIAGQGGRR